MGRKLLLAVVGCSALLGSVVATAGPASSALDEYPPGVALYFPANNRAYLPEDVGPAKYECIDNDGDLVSCVGQVPDGSPVDTSYGAHTFSVTATDATGKVTTRTASYTVSPLAALCSATALRFGSSVQGQVNGAEKPCSAFNSPYAGSGESYTARVLPLGLLNVTIEGARVTAGRNVDDTMVDVDRVFIQSNINTTYEILGIHTATNATFDPANPCAIGLTSSSFIGSYHREEFWGFGYKVTDLKALTTPVSIPLVIGTLHLNQLVVEQGRITRRGLFLDLPGTATDVVIGETRSGFDCLL